MVKTSYVLMLPLNNVSQQRQGELRVAAAAAAQQTAITLIRPEPSKPLCLCNEDLFLAQRQAKRS